MFKKEWFIPISNSLTKEKATGKEKNLGMMKGRKEGRNEGRKEGRKEERKEG